MSIPYVPPRFRASVFNCPYCLAFSDQYFYPMYYDELLSPKQPTVFYISKCRSCSKLALWNSSELLLPPSINAPLASSDMPDDIKRDFDEARLISNLSARASCALLRLCVEKLCSTLAPGKGSLNTKIKKLVAKGLDPEIQKALDSVRVIGAEAVHPLAMDLRDDFETANALFELVNLIVESTISKSKKINAIYGKLPPDRRKAIEQRDGTI